MAKVPLIPFQRPEPQVFQKPKVAVSSDSKSSKPAKAKKKKKAKGMAKTKAKPQFEAKNSEDITSKPKAVQRLWRILSKMDEAGTLFVNDVGVIGFEGDVPDDRTPDVLGLKPDEVKLLRPWAVLDGPEADDPETATGVLLTTYQIVELAYAMGKQDEHSATTKNLTAAVPAAEGSGDEDDEDDEFDPDDAEGDDEDEEFDEDDDDEMDVVDEDEYDEDDDDD